MFRIGSTEAQGESSSVEKGAIWRSVEAASALAPFPVFRGLERSSIGFFYRERLVYNSGRKCRRLLVPSAELKGLQRKVLNQILSVASPHPSAIGFVKGKSILDNAKAHHMCRFMLKVDVRDFFPSITERDVFSTIGAHFGNLDPSKLWDLCKIATCEGALPQGAPTSPQISNLYMKQFDARLTEAARNYGAIYTRYADDLVVSSGRESTIDLLKLELYSALSEMGLSLNPGKTKIFGPADRKVVTGLDVSNYSIRPTRAFRKSTKAMVRVLKHHDRDGISLRIYGRLCFWKSISPHDPELLKLLSEFSCLRTDRELEVGWGNRSKSTNQ